MTPIHALWVSALVALGGAPAEAPGPVTELSITHLAEQTSVRIAVDGDVEYREFTMEGPHRLVVDLMGARHSLPRDNYTDVNRGGIRAVRTSQYAEDIVRVVLELDGQAGYAVVQEPGGLRINLENRSGSFEPWSSGTTAAATSRARDTNVAEAAMQTLASARVFQPQSQARRISIQFTNSPIQDVLLAFAAFSGKSIVPGSNIEGQVVTADIRDQPWDVALSSILASRGLVAEENEYGIIRVDNINDLNARETVERIRTQAHRINYATAGELSAAIQPLLSERGSVTVGQGTNTLIVSDIDRVQASVQALLGDLDVRTPLLEIKSTRMYYRHTA